MSKIKLAILCTHPIQYQIPWFRALSREPEIELEVLFCHRATAEEQGAAGFGHAFDWDIPLLEGYRYRFLQNEASRPTIGSFNGMNTPQIASLIEDAHFDALIVHGWHYRSAWQTFRACWRTRTPLMVRGDSQLLTPRAAWKRFAKKAVYRTFIPRFDACLAVGRRSQEYFLHYGASADRVFLVPHVLDEEFYASKLPGLIERRLELREKWHIGRSSIVYAFVGKFLSVKRPMDFVLAIQKAARTCSEVEGIMIGDGPLRRSCEEYAHKNGVPVRFLGFLNQSEIMPAYVVSDALIVPSASETWGFVVNESMMCGRPSFVTTRVGCAPDLIIPGETGDTYDVGDIEALARLMAHHAGQPLRLKAMGDNARVVVQKFSIRSAIGGVVDALDAIQAIPKVS